MFKCPPTNPLGFVCESHSFLFCGTKCSGHYLCPSCTSLFIAIIIFSPAYSSRVSVATSRPINNCCNTSYLLRLCLVLPSGLCPIMKSCHMKSSGLFHKKGTASLDSIEANRNRLFTIFFTDSITSSIWYSPFPRRLCCL